MPRKDGTGPEGKGQRTGRGLRDCAQGPARTAALLGRGRGLGRQMPRRAGGR